MPPSTENHFRYRAISCVEAQEGEPAAVIVGAAERPARLASRSGAHPHKGTPAVGGAVRPAAERARCSGAELLVLQVAAGGVRIPEERGSVTTPLYLDQPQHEWPTWVSEFIGRLACVCPLAGLRTRLQLGEPAPEILRVARKESANLIVLAWKGDWTPERGDAQGRGAGGVLPHDGRAYPSITHRRLR